MKNILSPASREVLERFSRSEVLLAFDYDGTLAPIVPDPAKARMREQTRELLWELTQLYRVIVISGRAQLDALKKLRGVGVLEIVGNHGIEPWHATHRHSAEVRRWRPLLEARLASIGGVTVEDKVFSVAVHYRHSREKKSAQEAILEAASALGDVRIIGGKQVVNILPRNAPDKGIALERERERLHCETAIYVGDDETDEDVFQLGSSDRLLTIRVGRKGTSAAEYYVPSQAQVDDLLRLLVGLRREPDPRRRERFEDRSSS